MNLRRLVFATFLFALAGAVHAQSASNPQATLSIVQDGVRRIAPGATDEQPFAVRIVDAAGALLPGLVVEFFPDTCIPLPLLPDTCPLPDAYGHFLDTAAAQHAVTNADGVASATGFVAGIAPGIYNVAACAFAALHPENAIIGTALCVYFRIEQVDAGPTVPITPAFTGTWYDPAQSGHGLMIEVLPDDRLLAYWFTFDPDGASQAWFGGVGTIEDDLAFVRADMGAGGRWIPNFDPANYSLTPWGELIFQFSDCNHGRVDFTAVNSQAPYGTGHMDLTRLTMPAGLSCD